MEAVSTNDQSTACFNLSNACIRPKNLPATESVSPLCEESLNGTAAKYGLREISNAERHFTLPSARAEMNRR
jgi:hypothetical protein